jgi:hypothetical protein
MPILGRWTLIVTGPVFREQVTVVVVAWALDRERRRGEASNLVESLDTTVQPALGEPGK